MGINVGEGTIEGHVVGIITDTTEGVEGIMVGDKDDAEKGTNEGFV